MDDLIKRRYAIDKILECCPSEYDSEYDAGYDDGLRKAIFKLQRLPSAQTVDAVKHGKWIPNGQSRCSCSVCKDYVDDALYRGFNFCPNCGASMDAREQEQCDFGPYKRLAKEIEEAERLCNAGTNKMTYEEIQKYARNCPYFGNPKTIDSCSSCDLEFHYRPICPSEECICAKQLGYTSREEQNDEQTN